jgi:hypothetical protein
MFKGKKNKIAEINHYFLNDTQSLISRETWIWHLFLAVEVLSDVNVDKY